MVAGPVSQMCCPAPVQLTIAEPPGKSTRTSGNSDIASGVEDLKAAFPIVARETGRSKAHFYGASSGGIRAGAYAQAQPDRVMRYVSR